MRGRTILGCVGAALAVLVSCDERKCPDAPALKQSASEPASAPALAAATPGKLVIRNKCNVSEGGLYVFAAIRDVTTWAKRGDTDADEDAHHVGWGMICKPLVLGAPCRGTRYDLGDLEAGGINQNTSIERNDFRIAAIENSGFVLQSPAVGRPTITVDIAKETISYAARVDDDMPHKTIGRASCPKTKPLQ